MTHVFATQRLCVRRAKSADARFVHLLWTSPAVMGFVGFPNGLAVTIDEVGKTIEKGPDSEFGALLIVSIAATNQAMGQCKIGAPDADGICEPDIKLMPEYWGNGYGTELWSALIDHAFTHSFAKIVQGTPNRANTASVRMQMGAGMAKVDEGIFEPNLTIHPDAVPVPYYRLQIVRQEWRARRERGSGT